MFHIMTKDGWKVLMHKSIIPHNNVKPDDYGKIFPLSHDESKPAYRDLAERWRKAGLIE